MDSTESEATSSVSFEVPLIWCSSCKEKTENTDVTHTSCRGKTEDKVRVSIKALCAKCNKRKHTFHKNSDKTPLLVPPEIEIPTEPTESVEKKSKKKVSKKKHIVEEEPRITLTLSQLASFLNCKF